MAHAQRPIGRRLLLAGTAATVAAGAFRSAAQAAAPRTIRIGLAGTKTGSLAVFYEGLPYVLDLFKKEIGPMITINGTRHPYEILFRDTQSVSNRASQVAQDLIINEKIDLMLAFDSAETVIPVSDQCEAAGVPCITTVLPLDTYFFGRGAPKAGFQWTYNFFWGTHEFLAACVAAWNHLKTNKVIGALWPNLAGGRAFARVCPPVFAKAGYTLIDPGRFDLPSNYAAQVAAFKQHNVEIVHALIPPPQFITFWNEAAQQQFHPKAVIALESAEFAAGLIPLGKRAHGLSSDIWWSPAYPYASQLTGISSKELSAGYEKATGKQWLMILGMYHALFDVGFSALQKAADIDKPAAIRDAIRSNTFHTTVGPIDFRTGPFPNTSQTPFVMGQWWPGEHFPLIPIIEDNTLYPDIPVVAPFRPIPYV